MYTVKTLRRLVIVTVTLTAALLTTAAMGSTVEIKSVDNYAGNSNVYTDNLNTTIRVVELDANKNQVRSWTGTTDSDGKLTIPAGSNLSKPYLRAETADPKSAEFITPSVIGSSEPFTFAATGAVEGTIVSVQTVEGEIVATQKPDKHGRVFLSAGLAAGSYLISSGTRTSRSLGKIEVAPNWSNAIVEPYKLPTILSEARAVSLVENVRLKVQYCGADASRIAMSCLQDGDKREVVVLAASLSEITLAKPGDCGVRPGSIQWELMNLDIGKVTMSPPAVAYSASGRLTQVTVPSGMETHLVVDVRPANLGGSINARVVSGPVTLENGAGEMSKELVNGTADFRICTAPGSMGKFNVGWSLDAPCLPNGVPEQKKDGPGKTEALEDDGWVKFIDEDTKRTGKKRIIKSRDGVRIEEIRYDDDGSYAIKTTTKTETGSTVSTDTTIPGASEGTSTVIEETVTYDKDGNQLTGIRKTWKKTKDDRTLDKTETWDKKKGWR